MIAMSTLTRQLSAALRMLLALTLVCGVGYPLVVLGIGHRGLRLLVHHDVRDGLELVGGRLGRLGGCLAGLPPRRRRAGRLLRLALERDRRRRRPT